VVGVGAVAGLFTLPALLAVLGPKVNRFAVGRKRAPAPAGHEGGFWHSLSGTVMRRPLLTGAPVAVLLVVLRCRS